MHWISNRSGGTLLVLSIVLLLLATACSAGAVGDRGATGAAGATGPRGAVGSQGDHWSNHRTLALVMQLREIKGKCSELPSRVGE